MLLLMLLILKECVVLSKSHAVVEGGITTTNTNKENNVELSTIDDFRSNHSFILEQHEPISEKFDVSENSFFPTNNTCIEAKTQRHISERMDGINSFQIKKQIITTSMSLNLKGNKTKEEKCEHDKDILILKKVLKKIVILNKHVYSLKSQINFLHKHLKIWHKSWPCHTLTRLSLSLSKVGTGALTPHVIGTTSPRNDNTIDLGEIQIYLIYFSYKS